MKKDKLILYMRNLIFGAEDSLVSTVGLLSGIAVAGVSTQVIVLSGIVLIFVEAFSMGVGSYLSEYSTAESVNNNPSKFFDSVVGACIMFISYLIMGFVPIWPYVLIPENALVLSIISSLIALFILGLFSAEILKTRMIHSAVRMTIMGGVAIALGASVGKLISKLLV